MMLNEVIKQVDLSKRAIKFYEEQGLLQVNRDENGYRNFTQQDVKILKEISVYRKLGISLSDIKKLLKDQNQNKLKEILKKKEANLEQSRQEVTALKTFMETQNVEALYQSIQYDTIAQAIQDAVPGFYGFYFLNHFLPYLQIKMESKEQKEAYDRILNFWDNTEIQLPFVMKLTGWIMYRMPKPSMKEMADKLDHTLKMYLNPTPEEYEKLKKQVSSGVKLKNSFLYKYSISGFAQRKFMRELQNKGYNDIFIPSMMELSPTYKEYHDALERINARICKDLGLYYDAKFHLMRK